jgi:hypothetical protein
LSLDKEQEEEFLQVLPFGQAQEPSELVTHLQLTPQAHLSPQQQYLDLVPVQQVQVDLVPLSLGQAQEPSVLVTH